MDRPQDKVFVIHGTKREMGRTKTVSISFTLKDVHTVHYGTATVHSLDHFVKKTGRELSLDRLQEAPESLSFDVDLTTTPTAALITLVADALQVGYRNKRVTK